MADHDLNRWMRGVESEEPPELWTDISNRTPRRRPPRLTPRAVRYAGIALISVVVAAGIILPLRALLPLADRDKPTVRPAGPGTDAQYSKELWPSPPPITLEMLDLPEDWGELTGQALADHLGMKQSYSAGCDGWGSDGWCTSDVGDLTEAQQMGLLILLTGQSFDNEVFQSRLAQALIADAKREGDDARAAELNWMYVERPRILSNESYFAPHVPVVPAAPGEDTYVFSNIDFTYPYVPDGVRGATPDASFASLSFESDWSGDVYPGEAHCEVRFLSAEGTDVGGLSSGWSMHMRHVDPVDLLERAFPVTGVPVRVNWACSAGLKPLEGVTLDLLRVGRADGRLQLTAVLRAPTAREGGMGTQVCTISGTAPDGSTVTTGRDNTYDVPDGTKIHMELPVSFEGATNLQASCRPFTGQGG